MHGYIQQNIINHKLLIELMIFYFNNIKYRDNLNDLNFN